MLAVQDAAGDQDHVNRRVYHAPGVVRYYRSDTLDAAEMTALLAYQPAFAGRRVLDLGVGTGRTTRFLAPLASSYVGLDFSPVMIAAFTRRYPRVAVRQGDIRDLSMFDRGSFDFVLAGCNILDAVGHADRLRALGEISRVLGAGGVLMFSSHNRRFRDALSGPMPHWSRNPGTQALHLLRYARSLINHSRVGHLRHVAPHWAVLNDAGHDYALLHYYVDRETARAQVGAAGFQVVQEFDRSGQPLGPHDDDAHSSSVLYVAKRLGA